MNRLLYTVPEVAELLSMSRSMIYKLMDAREIESVKAGACRRITHQALVDYIESLR